MSPVCMIGAVGMADPYLIHRKRRYLGGMGPPGRIDRAAPGDLAAEPVQAGAPGRPRWLRPAAVAVAIGVALLLTAVVSFRWGAGETPSALPTATPRATPTGPPTTAEIYATLAPSVVTVETVRGGTVTATGTGVVVNAEGTILTALHVVSGGGSIRVRFADGTPSAATLLGSDPAIDIAALAASTLPELLVPAVLGNAGGLAIGDDVVAIGNQLGLTSSATAGVVSGLDRVTRGENGTGLSGLIQFDAAVNPGSSGGPLVNGRGETVGIVVALANPTTADTFIGIGFAVPIGAALAGGDEPVPAG
jgi:putative serine protease PepD